MKKSLRVLFTFAVVICIMLALMLPCFAATNIAGNEIKDGVAYRLSDDESYYSVVGYDENFSELNIVSDIGGIPVREIKASSFQNNPYLNSITIPDTVTTIGVAAFRGCQNLRSITLSANLKELPDECFYDCRLLKDITLPSGLQTIGNDCFKNCLMISNLKIPQSVTYIGYDAFLNCERINVSENPYAAEYAAKYNINTDFKSTSAYFILILTLSIAFGIAIFIILYVILKKYFAKYPSRNPAIYIGRFFTFIGKKIGSALKKSASFLKRFFIFAGKKIVGFFKIIMRHPDKQKEQKDDEK